MQEPWEMVKDIVHSQDVGGKYGIIYHLMFL